MNNEGLRAFEMTHRQHLERPTYAELYKIISEAARKHRVDCRLDALHFLTLNFEFMVAEPLGWQRSGTLAAILLGNVREAVDRDLETLFEEFGPPDRYGPGPRVSTSDSGSELDPSRPDLEDSPNGISSGRMLQTVAEIYDKLEISRWRLWG